MIPRNGQWVCGGCESALVYRDPHDEHDWHCLSCGLVFSVWSIADRQARTRSLAAISDDQREQKRGRPKSPPINEATAAMAQLGRFTSSKLLAATGLATATVTWHIRRARSRGLVVVERPYRGGGRGAGGEPAIYRWVGQALAEAV